MMRPAEIPWGWGDFGAQPLRLGIGVVAGFAPQAADAPLGAFHEREQPLDAAGYGCRFLPHLAHGLARGQAGAEQRPVRGPQRADLVVVDLPPAHAFDVQPDEAGTVALNDAERRDVLDDHRAAAEHRRLTETHELMDGRET